MKINPKEEERKRKLLESYERRRGDIRRRFEEGQNRNFNKKPATDQAQASGQNQGKRNNNNNRNDNNRDGNRDNNRRSNGNNKQDQSFQQSANNRRKMELSVNTRRGEVVHHQRMLTQDVNAQATQHIVGIPVNKSRYNGFNGTQITPAQAKNAKRDPNAVRVIPLGGLGEFGIGKNMTVIEYGDEAILIDMGTLFANDDYPGVNYMVPDVSYLEKNIGKVKAICFTHAHLDHIGACRHLLPQFGNLMPIYATDFTIGMIKKQMSELDDEPDLNYNPVDPFKHERIAVSEHLSVEFVHCLHSIPGSTNIVVRTPNGAVLVSGDWRFEKNPLGTPADYDRLLDIANHEGFALMLNESTNIDSPGTHPHSEFDVGDNIGIVMDHYANGRIIVSCFSSQLGRIELVLKEAAERGRKVAFAGYSMINNVEVALRARAIKIPKDTIMKMEDIVKQPDEKIVIICTGSQGEMNAVLNRMVTGAHKYIKVKASDTIVFSSNPIPGNEPKVVGTVDGLLREGAQVIQNGKSHIHNLGPLHLSGHAYYEDHVKFVTDMHPTNYMPYHGEFYMLEHNAEMAENVVGISKDRIIVCDDGDIIELTQDKKIRRAGRIAVGSKLFDDADKPVHEAVVKDRVHIAREGIFVVVLTLSKSNGHLIKTPDIVSRAFIYLDSSEELVGKIRHYLRNKTDRASMTTDTKTLKEEIKDDITHILFDATGHTPIVIPVINKV
jgi:ribonuclease J